MELNRIRRRLLGQCPSFRPTPERRPADIRGLLLGYAQVAAAERGSRLQQALVNRAAAEPGHALEVARRRKNDQS